MFRGICAGKHGGDAETRASCKIAKFVRSGLCSEQVITLHALAFSGQRMKSHESTVLDDRFGQFDTPILVPSYRHGYLAGTELDVILDDGSPVPEDSVTLRTCG